jgi:hypothetical protein
MCIIPRTPSPVPLTEREPGELTREELLALVNQQKQSLLDKELVSESEFFSKRTLRKAEEANSSLT